MTQLLTVNLPSDLFIRIKKKADEACHSVEAEAVQLLAATVAGAREAELEHSLASLELLDNAAVERVAHSQLASELAAELESLHFKQQREGLTDIEVTRRDELIRAYERCMLIRASAMALLNRRGIDITQADTRL